MLLHVACPKLVPSILPPCYTLQKLTGSTMNLANLIQEEKDKINVDLAASGVAYKERLNMPVVRPKLNDNNQHICASILMNV